MVVLVHDISHEISVKAKAIEYILQPSFQEEGSGGPEDHN